VGIFTGSQGEKQGAGCGRVGFAQSHQFFRASLNDARSIHQSIVAYTHQGHVVLVSRLTHFVPGKL
jgi:hypothetical protein